MDERFCLLTVHAHPDDEASKGPGTVAKYHAAGVRTVLVTCTGGEEGEILNPAMDTPEVKADIGGVRERELAAAAQVIGYDEVELLGYRDSGMAGSEANSHPDCLAAAPLEEAVGKLVEIVRRVRPQVIIGYGEDHSGYPHPDHIRAHEIALAAFEAAGDPGRFEEAGQAFQPLKLYYTVWSRRRIVEMHEKFLELGLESPFDKRWFERADQEDEITTSIELSGFEDVRRDALLAHATQIDPTSKFWFGLPPHEARKIYPYDDYVLGRNLVDSDPPETDLFAGIWASVSR
ncbi:MAG: mycothiol conjugate amidase Mca [Acidimicrobiales bacterium]|jgi:mycothiol S-conjugate amidase